jgi:DNA-binding LacI/PurR family transcriptional regulator
LALLFPAFWMPPQRNAFYSSLINAVTNEAASRGIHVQLVPWSVRSQIEVADSLTAQGFEAAVIIDFQQGYTAALYRMLERGQTFMIFNIRLPGLPLPSVVFDLDAASRQIAARLANLGHRNLCLMLHPHDFNKESERGLPRNQGKGSGWLRCLGEKGLLETCSRPLYMPWEPMLGLFSRDFRALLKSKDRPTAIVFGHSPWARAFLNDPEFSGFNVPGDLSLATFESTVNMPHVPWCPPLTSIDINYSRTAQCIMETMEKLLAGNDDIPSIRVPLDIRITESIGPAPGCRF